jgi:polygalacturonase
MLLDLGELGAAPGSDRLCTEILQGAIDRVHASGGGTVHVPAGIFRTGSFQLKSNVELRLAAGAVLQASGDLRDYLVWPYRHEEWGDTQSLLFAQDAENVSITGEGTIDLNDEPFLRWDVVKTDAFFTAADAARLTPDQEVLGSSPSPAATFSGSKRGFLGPMPVCGDAPCESSCESWKTLPRSIGGAAMPVAGAVGLGPKSDGRLSGNGP